MTYTILLVVFVSAICLVLAVGYLRDHRRGRRGEHGDSGGGYETDANRSAGDVTWDDPPGAADD